MNIGFIGCGQMGKMLLANIIKTGDAHSFLVTTRTKSSAESLKKNYSVSICESNERLVTSSDVIFLCVQPDDFNVVFNEIEKLDTTGKLFISITSDLAIEDRLMAKTKIIKTSPNTSIETGDGIILYSPGDYATENDIELFKNILRCSGSFIPVSSQMLKRAGKISGCGPAIIYTIIDAIVDSGIMLGLDYKLAKELAIKMVIGSAQKAITTGRAMEDLKREVTTPGGRSIQAISMLEKNGIRGIIMESFEASYNKSLPNGK